HADLAVPQSLKPALDGGRALFLLVGPGVQLDPGGLIDVVTAAGIRRITLLSSQGVATRPESPGFAPMRALEDAVQRSGVDWAILRAGGFDTNAFGWVPTIRAQRLVAAPFGEVAVPTIDPEDIAGVAAAALRDSAHAGRVYELTGPAAISPRQQAAAI